MNQQDERGAQVTEAHMRSAFNDLERLSGGYFTHESSMPLIRAVMESLHLGERVDLLAPIVLEENALQSSQTGGVVKPVGELCAGFAAVTQARVQLNWLSGGRMRPTHESASVPFDSIEAVNELVLKKWFEKNEGFEIMADRRWPIIFTNNPDAPKTDFWRSRLRKRVSGINAPLWHGEQVQRWAGPETAEAEGFVTAGQQQPKRYDLAPVAPALREDEKILAAAGGGRLKEGSLDEGTFYFTERRSLFALVGAGAEDAPEEQAVATAFDVVSTSDSSELMLLITCSDQSTWLWSADGASAEELAAVPAAALGAGLPAADPPEIDTPPERGHAFCDQCGSPANPADRFCGQCGATQHG